MDRRRALALVLAGLAAACGDPAPAPVPGGAPPQAPPGPPARTPGHERMLRALEEVRLESTYQNEYQGFAKVDGLAARLAALPADAPVRERWTLLAHLGEGEVLLGREREGLARLQEAYGLLATCRDDLPEGWPMELTFRLGTAWMRLGETENCCARNTPESCILPFRGAAIHGKPEGSRKAMACFLEVLEGTEPGSLVHRKALWLLNISAMTLDEYPDGVPERLRIPEKAFASAEPFPRFENVAGALGLATFGLSGGVVAEDFDGDGDIDLLVSNMQTDGQLRYHRNGGDGTFTDRTEEAGLAGLTGGLNMVQADYDNDGAVDVLVLRGAWFGKVGAHPNSLLRNDGRGRFTDVTFAAGLGRVHFPTQTAAWADFDNDGDLDLYVGNETAYGVRAPCQLFLNLGDGTFTDVAGSAGVTNDRFTKAAVWGDYDADGLPDLYVSNLGAENRLYRNGGDGTFTDVAPRLGLQRPVNSFPAWFWDFDNDGNLDLYVAGYPAGAGDAAAWELGLPFEAELNRLYRGTGGGTFEEVAADRGLVKPTSPMGANFGDLDDDGFPDFLLGTGNTSMWDLIPNLLYRNHGGERFSDVTMAGGFGHLQKGHGIAFADFDGDGDLDVFAEMGGAFLGDKYHDALWENPGFGNRRIEVRLTGVRSNRSAIGARIRAEFTEDGRRRSVHAVVGSGGSFGANPLRQHLGLGKASRVDVLQVTWPTSGTVQTFRDLPADRLVEITEGADRPEIREPAPARPGGK